MEFKFLILKNETEKDHLGWINACEKRSRVNYKVIDLTRNDWLDQIIKEDFDCLLTRPPDTVSFFKQLYDERIYILHKVLGFSIYPTLDEILIYENKRMLAYWLEANKIPHPKTWIFYHKKNALEFVENCKLPIVAKTSIGAAGFGVKIFRYRFQIKKYINRAFSSKGIKRKFLPNRRRGEIGKRFINTIKNPSEFYKKIRRRFINSSIDPQRWFIILQEYIPADFEWRTVRIGNSFFAHKKLRNKGEMFSGTSKVGWDRPSPELLDFVKYITDKGNFLSQAIDIFETKDGNYYVNEIQCYFGSKNPYQMVLNGKPGRYRLIDDKWTFEEGNFNTNNSYDLRLENIIDIINKNR
ncbi:MAG: ATP-grasp domain-containing protein [Candidatus Helarchaeota archaeon]